MARFAPEPCPTHTAPEVSTSHPGRRQPGPTDRGEGGPFHPYASFYPVWPTPRAPPGTFAGTWGVGPRPPRRTSTPATTA
eukprot:1373836-Lingulodinium_polyedra.AAC.1